MTPLVDPKQCGAGVNSGGRQRTFSVITTAVDALNVRSCSLLDSESGHILALSQFEEIRGTAGLSAILRAAPTRTLWCRPQAEITAHMKRVRLMFLPVVVKCKLYEANTLELEPFHLARKLGFWHR
jgi:hypothetical protein